MSSQQATANNVISMPTPDPRDTHVRAFAGMRALYMIKEKLIAAQAVAKADWKEKKSAATKEYREPIRDQFDAIVGVNIDLSGKDKGTQTMKTNYAEAFIVVVRGVKNYDNVKSDADADKKARKDRIDAMEMAIKECVSAATVNPNQGSLFPPTGGSVDGLAWASAATRAAMFTSLKELDRDKVTLDCFQESLLLDLGGAGIEELDLGLDASTAVEADGVEAEPPTEGEGASDDDLGFD
jgi:hypothetical protein